MIVLHQVYYIIIHHLPIFLNEKNSILQRIFSRYIFLLYFSKKLKYNGFVNNDLSHRKDVLSMKRTIFRCLSVSALALSLLLIPVSGELEAKTAMTLQQAQNAAQKKVPSSHVKKVETEMENGVALHEVELIKNSKEYNLKYRASDGKLVAYEWELPNTSYSIQNRKNLTKAKIKEKARKLVSGAKITSTHLTIDDGLSEYKLNLTKGDRQYKLLYNAKNGKLLEYEWKIISSGSSSSKYIGLSKAKNIALKKVPGAAVVKAEFDKDDGVPVYEIELRKGAYEYEITIDAKTGNITEYEQDIDD